MTEIIHSTGETLSEGERRVERDLGSVISELEHVTADVAEHTTTIQGLKDNREWITERLEALARDLEALPRVPEELTRTFSDAITDLTTRLDRLEAAATHDEETTEPPHRREHDEEERDESEDGRERHGRRSWLDDVF